MTPSNRDFLPRGKDHVRGTCREVEEGRRDAFWWFPSGTQLHPYLTGIFQASSTYRQLRSTTSNCKPLPRFSDFHSRSRAVSPSLPILLRRLSRSSAPRPRDPSPMCHFFLQHPSHSGRDIRAAPSLGAVRHQRQSLHDFEKWEGSSWTTPARRGLVIPSR